MADRDTGFGRPGEALPREGFKKEDEEGDEVESEDGFLESTDKKDLVVGTCVDEALRRKSR